MRKRAVAIVSVLMIGVGRLTGQSAPAPVPSAAANPKKPKEKLVMEKPAGGIAATQPGAPVTTDIYADEAFFDSNKDMGIFTGHVKVTDPRFNLQSERLTVFIGKGENQGLEKAIAEGNVAMVRDRPDPNGGAPTRSVGRSDKATYIAATGDVELTGTPRVQEGLNTHIATSPDTVMVVNQNGQLTTHGPSRTEIRQQPKDEQKTDPKPAASPKASIKP
jgi:lipopolysaccharide transport protein LptA